MRGEPQKTPQISSSLPVQEINSRSANKLAQKYISFSLLYSRQSFKSCNLYYLCLPLSPSPSPISISFPVSISLAQSLCKDPSSLPLSMRLRASLHVFLAWKERNAWGPVWAVDQADAHTVAANLDYGEFYRVEDRRPASYFWSGSLKCTYIQQCFICRPSDSTLGRWDCTQDCCDFGIGCQTLWASDHSARSRTLIWRP